MSAENKDDEDVIEETKKLLESSDFKNRSLITLLQDVQDRFGYLPRDAMLEVAQSKGIPKASVFGVASFYNQFRFIPPGKYPVKMCMGTACHIKGGNAILKVWETKLGIKEGEVTEDRLYSLDRVACVGCCALAPVSLVGEDIHGDMMPTKVDGIMYGVQLAEEKEKIEAEKKEKVEQ